MRITREDVVRVAELANLDLTSAEVDTYQAQLDQILGYVDKLNQVDISKVEPMSQVTFPAASDGAADSHPELREDVVRPCDAAEPILAQAAEAAKPFFRVPKVIER